MWAGVVICSLFLSEVVGGSRVKKSSGRVADGSVSGIESTAPAMRRRRRGGDMWKCRRRSSTPGSDNYGDTLPGTKCVGSRIKYVDDPSPAPAPSPIPDNGARGDNQVMMIRQSPPGVEVPYIAYGNSVKRNASILVYESVARPEDYEVVVFVASNAGGARDKPQEGDRLAKQGFQLIGAKGLDDKKVELWIRKNNGRGDVTLCEPCGLWTAKGREKGGLGCGWGVMTIQGVHLDLNTIKHVAWRQAKHPDMIDVHSPTSRTGFNLLAICFDDSTEVVDAGKGDIAVSKFKFGDGDGVSLVAWQPGQSLPSQVLVKKHDKRGGSQLEAITANFVVS